jgi:hypothetical protein
VSNDHENPRPGVIQQLRERGVLRVAASYAVIAWLVLQIADVIAEPRETATVGAH